MTHFYLIPRRGGDCGLIAVLINVKRKQQHTGSQIGELSDPGWISDTSLPVILSTPHFVENHICNGDIVFEEHSHVI